MNYQVTAIRKRPKSFDELKGQDFIISTIKNAIEEGKIAHAYLFSGPRGTGKTSSARLLAKSLNCQKGPKAKACNKCSNCIEISESRSADVIEIDGASNTSVSDVRIIRDEILFPPTSSKYKIYIIDEVHMLSTSAFNALLKTIEEPPEYVIFIFATTETHKVPQTIKSRCQQFHFQLFSVKLITKILMDNCKEMKIEADEDALTWIAKEATGSLRDAYTLFDQILAFSENKITLDKIVKALGLVKEEEIANLVHLIVNEDRKKAIVKLNELINRGSSIDYIIKALALFFKSLLLLKSEVRDESLIFGSISLYNEFIVDLNIHQVNAALDLVLKLNRDIKYTLDAKIDLELAISKLCSLKSFVSVASLLQRLEDIKKEKLIDAQVVMKEPVSSKSYDNKEEVSKPVSKKTSKSELVKDFFENATIIKGDK